MAFTMIMPAQMAFADDENAESPAVTEAQAEAQEPEQAEAQEEAKPETKVETEAPAATEEKAAPAEEATEAAKEDVKLQEDESVDESGVVWLRGSEGADTAVKTVKGTSVSNSNPGIASATLDGNKLTIKAIANGETTITVGDSSFEVRVYAPLYIRAIDITDKDNPKELKDKAYITKFWFEPGTKEAFGAKYLNEYYFSGLIYEAIMKVLNDGYSQAEPYFSGLEAGEDDYYGGTYRWDFYYLKNDEALGQYVLKFEDWDAKTPIAFKYQGRLLQASRAVIDGKRVWCIEPLVGTTSGSKYDSKNSEEKTKAALAVIFGDDSNDVSRAITQAMIWEAVGYDGISNDPLRILPNYESGAMNGELVLSSEETDLIDTIKARIKEATALYEGNAKADFVSKTPGATIENGKLVLTKGKIPKTIVLEAKNKTLLKYYADGVVKYSDGITGVIDKKAGTLTLTIDESKLNNKSGFSLSMIPSDVPSETMTYYSHYEKQTLMEFGIENPKFEEYGLLIKDEPKAPVEDKDSSKATTKKSRSPKTSDESPITAMLLLMALAAVGLGVAGRQAIKH